MFDPTKLVETLVPDKVRGLPSALPGSLIFPADPSRVYVTISSDVENDLFVIFYDSLTGECAGVSDITSQGKPFILSIRDNLADVQRALYVRDDGQLNPIVATAYSWRG